MKSLKIILVISLVGISIILTALLTEDNNNILPKNNGINVINKQTAKLDTPPNNTKSSVWKKYTNNTYGFEIEYPDNWYIVETNFVGNPGFVIYKDKQATSSLSYKTNTTLVSVYPKGWPGHGLAGETIESDFNIQASTTSKFYDQILSNGERWGTYVKLVSTNKNWNDSGFIQARVKINNYDVICKPIVNEPEYCSWSDGDTLVAVGTLNHPEDREIERRIFSSFKFID